MKGAIMNIRGGDELGMEVKVEKATSAWSSKFEMMYSDTMPPEIKKGDLNPRWGLKHDVTFHIVTELDSKRYLDMLAPDRFVIKTPNGFKTQSFYFDGLSKTIKSSSND
jgi:hypothetical protein